MTNDIYSHPGVFVHTSQRQDGSMKNNGVFHTETIAHFLQKNAVEQSLVVMNQVHGTTVQVVEHMQNTPFTQTDGIICKERNIALGVVTADCLPIVLFDPEQNVYSAVHAGYRGLYDGIIDVTLKKYDEMGSTRSNILVGVGPAIGVCCYNISDERADMFAERFGKEFIEYRDDKRYLDLKKIAMMECITRGVTSEKISVQDICTQSSLDTYFSYRGDSTETFGELITVIGVTE